jgi:2-dehydropantoate 2-reductase
MRIAVIGAGAVGGVIAALADRAGHDVSLTARGAQLDAIRADGLHLTGHWGEHRAHPRASGTLSIDPENPYDLVLLTVKAQDAAAALEANAGALPEVPLVVVQNGLGGAAAAAAAHPATPVVGALALFAASYLSPGEVSITTPATTYLGLPTVTGRPGAPGAPAASAAAPAAPEAAALDLARRTLGDLMPIAVSPNFEGAQWTKLIVNQINALPAITGMPVQQTISDPRLRAVLTASMREAVAVARQKGVRFETVLGLSDPLLRAFSLAPKPLARLLPRLMARRMGATPNPGSTLQSIRRGQLTEIDHLNGAVVGAARELGREAPVNAALVALVHRVEREKRFVAPAEVAALVPH